MRTTFEEKTYENYFNIELAALSKVFFPLGQVQEGNLGFDASAFSVNHRLWHILGYPDIFPFLFGGCELREVADEMEDFLEVEINNIPKMKLNLLFQYKKPEYMISSTAKDWDKWGKPFYRYGIYEEQQKLLMNIHTNLGSRVLVIYAAPALHDANELVDAYLKKEILDHSNFTKAVDLNLHHRNTYIQGGTYSIACSEEEEILNFNLIDLLEKTSAEANVNKEEDNKDFIINFRKEIEKVISENWYYSESFSKLNEPLSRIEEYELFYSFLVLSNFRQLTGTQWLVKL